MELYKEGEKNISCQCICPKKTVLNAEPLKIFIISDDDLKGRCLSKYMGIFIFNVSSNWKHFCP